MRNRAPGGFLVFGLLWGIAIGLFRADWQDYERTISSFVFWPVAGLIVGVVFDLSLRGKRIRSLALEAIGWCTVAVLLLYLLSPTLPSFHSEVRE